MNVTVLCYGHNHVKKTTLTDLRTLLYYILKETCPKDKKKNVEFKLYLAVLLLVMLMWLIVCQRNKSKI